SAAEVRAPRRTGDGAEGLDGHALEQGASPRAPHRPARVERTRGARRHRDVHVLARIVDESRCLRPDTRSERLLRRRRTEVPAALAPAPQVSIGDAATDSIAGGDLIGAERG